MQPVERMMIAVTPANSFFMGAPFPFGHSKAMVTREEICNERCRFFRFERVGKRALPPKGSDKTGLRAGNGAGREILDKKKGLDFCI